MVSPFTDDSFGCSFLFNAAKSQQHLLVRLHNVTRLCHSKRMLTVNGGQMDRHVQAILHRSRHVANSNVAGILEYEKISAKNHSKISIKGLQLPTLPPNNQTSFVANFSNKFSCFATAQFPANDTSILGAEATLAIFMATTFLGQGFGNFNPQKDHPIFNLVNPVEKNTMSVPSGKWIAIRFRADNLGNGDLKEKFCHYNPKNRAEVKMTQTQLQAVTLLSKMLKNPPLEALSLFNSATQQGLYHTHQSITVILHHFLSFDMPSYAQSLIQRVLCGGLTSPLFTLSSLLSHLTQDTRNFNCPLVYEVIINAHVNSQLQPEQALFYFDQMIDKGFVPQSTTLNNVLNFLVKRNKFEKAWFVFDRYKGRIVTDAYTFGILMKGCRDTGDLKRGFQVLDQMSSMGYSPNVVVYTTLIDGCCKNGEVEKAKELFCKMEELGLVANQYTYTVLINGLFKKGLKTDGFELYEKMKLDGALPDLYTYNCVMYECCKDGKISEAYELFDEMRERGVACNVVTYNTLIWGLCGEKKMREAEKLLVQIKQDGLSPTIVTYTTLINGYCHTWKLNKALSLFNQLKSFGLTPSLTTYNVLIAGFSRTENPSRVLDLVREMEERGISPSQVTYTILIDAFARSFDMEKAVQILSRMKKANLLPDVCTYGVLINGWCSQGNMKEASMLFRSMDETSVRPNDVIYNTMISGYCKEGSSYKALKLLQEMCEKRIIPNEASYNMTIQVLWDDEKWEDAQILCTNMIKYGLRPSKTLFDITSKAKAINV
ncbi:unnamed protein product [Fraxinus pennsylvanica]|uniref:Plastocyanin-like domain-containing protein n=1 Tax=Fraxinus pennsylvanica TaxID=56036 RepID=A0AAD1ZJC0_9LAMI|nr:unnamed protein product [Fraxinus pennsylvanica]